MTAFDDLRKKVLQQGALSLFSETVTWDDRQNQSFPTVKIEHRQAGPRHQSTGVGSQPQVSNGTVDQTEQIRVTVDRSEIETTPQQGATLIRSVAKDSDQRPFVFSGEVVFSGPVHAVYIFQRPLRTAQGRRA
jgi:hypothetical protein